MSDEERPPSPNWTEAIGPLPAPEVSAQALVPAEEVVVAEVVEPAPRPLRIWTVLVLGVCTIPLSMVIGSIVLAAAAVTLGGVDLFQEPQKFMGWVNQFAQSRSGLILLVLPSQIMFLLVPVAAACLSPQPFRTRLALERGSAPLWAWLLFVVGTPTVGVLSSLLLSGITDEMSEQIKLMEEMMRAHSRDFFPGLLLLVAVLPGMVEEVMFRGYVQSRLLQRWPPVAAILLTTVLFSAAHLDPMHALGVLPLGFWLGIIAWRTESVLPAIACHIVNNAVAVCMSKYGTEAPLPEDTLTLGVLAISVPAFLIGLYLLLRRN